MIAEEKKTTAFKVNLHPSCCASCPINDVCPKFEITSTSCGVVEEAVNDMFATATQFPYVQMEHDKYALRSLAAMQASLLIAELYFKKHGIIYLSMFNGQTIPKFSTLFKEWQRLNTAFQNGLAKFGMTPASRVTLDYMKDSKRQSALEGYVDGKYTPKEVTDGGTESTPESKHRRFLQRSAATKPEALRDSRSNLEARLRDSFNEEPGGSVELDDIGGNSDGSGSLPDDGGVS